jgi:hypothetical protein
MGKVKRGGIFYQRTFYAFNTLNFGGIVNIQFNNNTDLISDCLLEFNIDASGTTLRNLPAVRCIDRIEVIIGGSMPYILLANDIWNYMYDSAESTSKRDTIIEELAGGVGGVQTDVKTVYLPLGHLPWSKIQAGGVADRKIPFDSTLCGQIKMYIYLADSANVYSANAKNSLLGGKLYVRSATMPEPEHKLILKENQALSYPFGNYCQSFISPQFTPANVTQQQNVYLVGFKSAQCTSILLRCVDVAKQKNDGQSLNTMSNIILSLNGQILFKQDFDSSKALSLFQNKCATSWTYGGKTYWYVQLNFSHQPVKNSSYGAELEEGLTLTNQQLLLQFTSSSTNAQLVEATYIYNSALIVQNQNCEIVF